MQPLSWDESQKVNHNNKPHVCKPLQLAASSAIKTEEDVVHNTLRKSHQLKRLDAQLLVSSDTAGQVNSKP